MHAMGGGGRYCSSTLELCVRSWDVARVLYIPFTPLNPMFVQEFDIVNYICNADMLKQLKL